LTLFDFNLTCDYLKRRKDTSTVDGSKHVLQAASCAKGNIYHSRFHCVDLPFTNGKHGDFEIDDLPLMLGARH
jgi:hypothetical protein